ncbi:hypothetical protein [Echinicola shivajiensis]|uniref:hypothetical protein n=1 Tax=Echinicola shivajiensis TaxID=1035916 RepID=UPI001BFC15C7|nr:hypothetical protein [Echinicola shivajiensis]
MSDEEARSILFFLFDSPHPVIEKGLVDHLSPSKKQLLADLFEKALSSDNEITDLNQAPTTYKISDYVGAEHYFIIDLDINNDTIPDKVVSAGPYQEDELLLFVNKNDHYELALKTVNFSEDGGNQIKHIKKDKNGFVIETAFPDRGLFEAHYFIIFKNGRWMLTHTIYKTESGNEKDAFTFVCKVTQNIDLRDKDLLYKLKTIPDETIRDSLCTKEKRH